MGKFTRADDEIVELVTQVRERWHPQLEFARIGVLMRFEAPANKGRLTLGKAKKATDEERLLSREELDFIVWFAQDQWDILTDEQKAALVDHELCHCSFGSTTQIRPHDIEEFNAVLRRHGFWWPGAEQSIDAVQPHFGFMNGDGGVEAIDPEPFNERDVLEQVDEVVEGNAEGDAA